PRLLTWPRPLSHHSSGGGCWGSNGLNDSKDTKTGACTAISFLTQYHSVASTAYWHHDG
ncbi:hypothetical protein M9458_032606, partial [Cirrhinus mrigala]